MKRGGFSINNTAICHKSNAMRKIIGQVVWRLSSDRRKAQRIVTREPCPVIILLQAKQRLPPGHFINFLLTISALKVLLIILMNHTNTVPLASGSQMQ